MKRAQPGWLVLALAGIAAAIGSFLPFYTFGGELDLTVWNRSLFPTATLIPVLVVAIALEALFVLLIGREPRSPFLNFTWSQARLAGSAFAIVLALAYAVQGRAGASLGPGYIVMSLSTLATFAGAVMTRRAELARKPDEIVEVEHPWRAAALRWRREMTARVQEYAAGGSASAHKLEPIPDETGTPKAEAKKDEPVDETIEEPAPPTPEPSPAPSPVPHLSAVQSEPDTEKKPKTKSSPPARKRAKRAKKVAPAPIESPGGDASPAKDGDSEGDAAAEATTEANADATAEVKAVSEEERERPAAPG